MGDFIEGFMVYLCILLIFLFGVVLGRYGVPNVPENEKSMSFYKQYVVIDKNGNTVTVDSCGAKFEIRATDYELSLYELGDTIK